MCNFASIQSWRWLFAMGKLVLVFRILWEGSSHSPPYLYQSPSEHRRWKLFPTGTTSGDWEVLRGTLSRYAYRDGYGYGSSSCWWVEKGSAKLLTKQSSKREKKKREGYQKKGMPLFRPLEWFYSASEADPDLGLPTWFAEGDVLSGVIGFQMAFWRGLCVRHGFRWSICRTNIFASFLTLSCSSHRNNFSLMT